MTALPKIGPFSGIAPRIHERLLPKGMGQTAENCRLFSGVLSSWRRPLKIVTATKAALGTIQTIFRMNDGVGGPDFWLNWITDVNCVRGPIAGDDSQRIFYTGDGEPRQSNFALATSGADYPTQFYVLGAFPPSTKPTVGHTGGAAANVTRSFVYTFVYVWPDGKEDESQPSPPESHTAPSDATWDVTAMMAAPANTFATTAGSWAAGIATLTVASTFGLRLGEEIGVTGVTPSGYNVAKAVITALTATTVKYAVASNPGAYSAAGTVARTGPHNTGSLVKRIYVTATGTTDAEFLFWVEKSAASTTHSGAITDANLGEPLPSETWAMPPSDMKGLISFENGVLAAFAKNELCFCEPYRPHAWPTGYRQSTNRDIVGIGAFGKSIVVGTRAQAWTCSGTHPANYSMERVNRNEPCLSKRSVTSFPFGVLYASPNGLMLVGEGGATLASEPVVTKREWAAFLPATIFAQEFQGRYFAWYDDGDDVIKGFIFDRSGQGPDLVTLSIRATAACTDAETGDLYLVEDGDVKQFDSDPLNLLPYEWLSGVMVAPQPMNPGYAKVEAAYEDLDDFNDVIAQRAADLALNAVILAGSETHPGQGMTKGEVNGMMFNEFMWNGSLLHGGLYPEFDNRTLVFQLYARDPVTNQMELKHTEYPARNTVFSLPAGYEETDFAVKLSGNIEAHSAEIAETAEELAQI